MLDLPPAAPDRQKRAHRRTASTSPFEGIGAAAQAPEVGIVIGDPTNVAVARTVRTGVVTPSKVTVRVRSRRIASRYLRSTTHPATRGTGLGRTGPADRGPRQSELDGSIGARHAEELGKQNAAWPSLSPQTRLSAGVHRSHLAVDLKPSPLADPEGRREPLEPGSVAIVRSADRFRLALTRTWGSASTQRGDPGSAPC